MCKIILIQFLLLSHFVVAQKLCDDEMIMSTKGKWQPTEHIVTKAGKYKAQVVQHIDAIRDMFMSAYPSPMGLEAIWYRTATADPILKDAPIPYSFWSLYKTWFCSKPLNKMLLGEETGTWAYAFVNHFSWFISHQYDKLPYEVNGLYVFRLPPKKGEWRGYPLYEVTAHKVRNCIILLRPGGQLPWKPISQRQFLSALRADLDKRRTEQMKNYVRQDSNFRAGVEVIRRNTYMQPADREKAIANMQKSRDRMLATREKDSTKAVDYWNVKIKVIDDYTSSVGTETLKQPAIVSNSYEFKGSFSSVETGGTELVTMNPAYFRKDLPPYIPQMIILYWRWMNDTPSKDFKRQLEANFPVEKLQAMIQ